MVVATEALDTGIKASDYMIINGCTTVMIKKEYVVVQCTKNALKSVCVNFRKY